MVTRQRPRSTRLLVVVLVSISLAVITLDYRQGEDGPLAGLGRAALAFMAPLQEAVTEVTRPVGDFFIGLVHLPSLEDENQRLRRELEDVRAAEVESGFQQQQLEQLQDLLGLEQSLAPDSVASVVIANGLSNFRYTITIDVGSSDGVKIGMPVITGSEAAPRLVGRVVRVSLVSSEVQLLIDRGFSVAGKLTVSGETGLVEGQGESDPRMSLVTPGTLIEGNEPVVTQAYEVNGARGAYPPGLIIGTVSRSVPTEAGLEEFVTVRPAVDFSALEFVLVLLTGGEG
ncbi:MAG TPA: rod shape-determining protein MreC [Actinomycetota bacterium]